MMLFARAPSSRNGGPGGAGRARRVIVSVVLAALLLPVVAVLAYRFVPPPITPLMVIRWAGGAPVRQRWVPLARISPALIRAVVASEDEKFCFHHGFDWDQLGESWKEWRAGHAPRGASTISMQTAKNLFLWPGRSILRKGIEAYFTVLIELFWSKQRIIETYLNVIEWGNGIYGADMAARLYFGKPASALTQREAALFAAVLPNPRRWSPAHPDAYIDERAATIRARMPAMAVPSAGGGCR
jgi:monofunctional biosynthetic peptidoglycan transglycosylase